MAFRRVLYALLLLGALLFQITNDNYLAYFLLSLVVVMPVLSLALSLPGMLGCRVELSAVPAALDRGGDGQWLLTVDTPNALPLARLSVALVGENLLTGETERRKLRLSGVARRRPVELSAPTGHCGLLELQAKKITVYDCLGLFSRRVAPPPPARLLCRPVPIPAELPALPEGQGTRSAPAGALRQGPGEDCDLRDYRPGDPMRSVHWKLTSKWDKLIVRERTQGFTPLPLLTLDRFGPPARLDRLLDRVLGVSQALLAVQRPHNLLWLDKDGQPVLRSLSDEGELAACLLDLLGAFAPPTGPALDEHPDLLVVPGGAALRIHVTPEGGEFYG